jgi:hypothetical protein
MDHAAKRKVPLVWILLPVMRDSSATADAKLISDIVADAAKGRSHVHLVETARVTSDDKGNYVAHFKDLAGNVRQMRASDGVHFELAAYELLADLVLKKLREVSPRFKSLGPE